MAADIRSWVGNFKMHAYFNVSFAGEMLYSSLHWAKASSEQSFSGGLYKQICQMSKPDGSNLGFRLGIRLRMQLGPHRSKIAPHSTAEDQAGSLQVDMTRNSLVYFVDTALHFHSYSSWQRVVTDYVCTRKPIALTRSQVGCLGWIHFNSIEALGREEILFPPCPGKKFKARWVLWLPQQLPSFSKSRTPSGITALLNRSRKAQPFQAQLDKAPANLIWPQSWPCFEQEISKGGLTACLGGLLQAKFSCGHMTCIWSIRFHFLLEEGGSLSYMRCNTLLMEEEQVTKHAGIWKVFWMSGHTPFHRRSHGERQQVSMNEMETKHFGDVL